jgi:hypothetical protein
MPGFRQLFQRAVSASIERRVHHHASLTDVPLIHQCQQIRRAEIEILHSRFGLAANPEITAYAILDRMKNSTRGKMTNATLRREGDIQGGEDHIIK